MKKKELEIELVKAKELLTRLVSWTSLPDLRKIIYDADYFLRREHYEEIAKTIESGLKNGA